MTSTVLHVSADMHDVFDVDKPLVVGRLVDALSARARNVVISINRTSNPFAEAVHRSDDLWALRYFAPPKGLLLSVFLDRLARRIARLLDNDGLRPDILVGHKFTLEAVVCARLGQILGIPYIACFQGNTDCKIFRFKPQYRRRFGKVARNARALVFPTPWCQRYFDERLLAPNGISHENQHLIPFISGAMGAPARTSPQSRHRFITICRVDAWRLKNTHRLIEAISVLRRTTSDDWSLDIVGPASARTRQLITKMIERFHVTSSVRMLGSRSRHEIDTLLPEYCAMVLPSQPESFGLVYLEALLRGVPIMCAKGAGFDGFFERAFPGVVVAHESLDEITEGLKTLSTRSEELRENIQRLEDDFDLFRSDDIESRFSDLLGLPPLPAGLQ